MGSDFSQELNSNESLNLIKLYKGKAFFIPGNLNALVRKESIVEGALDGKDVIIPDDGCPGPEVKNLNKNVKLIALNSQWWLETQSDQDTGCRNKNKFQIIEELKELLDKNDDKYIILAIYHSVIADGIHNGYIEPYKYLLPLPVIGLTKPFFNKMFGSDQNFTHPQYSEFRDEILQSIKGYKNVIVCSANENNLQYFEADDQHFIISGSGSETSPLPKNSKALFSLAEKGLARLDFDKNGSVRVNFMIAEGDGNKSPKYSKEIIKPIVDVPEFENTYELTEFQISKEADGQYDRGLLHRFIFGDLYRKDWSKPINFQSLNLSKESGGLRPLKLGGGFTSTTLRLENRSGKQFVLRSVKKTISKSVPLAFRNSFVRTIWQDHQAGSQPYAALAVSPLAEAAGVYHTEPRLFYVPKQKVLGEFNAVFGDDIYLFEERPTGDHKDEESIVDSDKVISYHNLLKRVIKKISGPSYQTRASPEVQTV